MKKDIFILYIEDAGGPIQLNLMNDTKGHGKRLLGPKASPYKKTIKQWKLSYEQLNTLIHEMSEILNETTT